MREKRSGSCAFPNSLVPRERVLRIPCSLTLTHSLVLPSAIQLVALSPSRSFPPIEFGVRVGERVRLFPLLLVSALLKDQSTPRHYWVVVKGKFACQPLFLSPAVEFSSDAHRGEDALKSSVKLIQVGGKRHRASEARERRSGV